MKDYKALYKQYNKEAKKLNVENAKLRIAMQQQYIEIQRLRGVVFKQQDAVDAMELLKRALKL